MAEVDNRIEKTEIQEASVSPDSKKPIEYTFDEGVRLVLLAPDQVYAEFSTLGLVANDLFRFVPAYNNGERINHEENFENALAKYLQSISPDLKLKRVAQIKLTTHNHAQMHAFVQRFPNHLSEEMQQKKENLPLAGKISREYDVEGIGKGEKGLGYHLTNPDDKITDSFKKSNPLFDERDPADLYKDMKSAKPDGTDVVKVEREASETLYRLKEGTRIKLSSKTIEKYFEPVEWKDKK